MTDADRLSVRRPRGPESDRCVDYDDQRGELDLSCYVHDTTPQTNRGQDRRPYLSSSERLYLRHSDGCPVNRSSLCERWQQGGAPAETRAGAIFDCVWRRAQPARFAVLWGRFILVPSGVGAALHQAQCKPAFGDNGVLPDEERNCRDREDRTPFSLSRPCAARGRACSASREDASLDSCAAACGRRPGNSARIVRRRVMYSTKGYPRQVTDAQVEAILEWHRTHNPLRVFAQEIGLNKKTIWYVIKRNGQYKLPWSEKRSGATRSSPRSSSAFCSARPTPCVTFSRLARLCLRGNENDHAGSIRRATDPVGG